MPEDPEVLESLRQGSRARVVSVTICGLARRLCDENGRIEQPVIT